jgi:hypothetical protein
LTFCHRIPKASLSRNLIRTGISQTEHIENQWPSRSLNFCRREWLNFGYTLLFQSAKPRRWITFNIAIGVELVEDSFHRLHDTVDAPVTQFPAFDFNFCRSASFLFCGVAASPELSS